MQISDIEKIDKIWEMSGRSGPGGASAPPSVGGGMAGSGGGGASAPPPRDMSRKHRRGSRESVLPPACKNHLNSLFKEIEKEFTHLYLENARNVFKVLSFI